MNTRQAGRAVPSPCLLLCSSMASGESFSFHECKTGTQGHSPDSPDGENKKRSRARDGGACTLAG